MGSSCDDAGMGRDRDLDDRLVEDILQGRVDQSRGEHRRLAETVRLLRSEVAAEPVPQPSEALLQIFALGVSEDDAEGAPLTAPSPVADPAARAGRAPLLRRPLAKIAGLSLFMKLVLGGAAVAAAAVGGAGVAGVLPGQDGPAPTDDVESAEEADFGREIAEDAQDGGVDGADVAERARQLRDDHRRTWADHPARGIDDGHPARGAADQPRDRDGDARDETDDGGPAEERGRSGDAPGAEQRGPSERGAEARERGLTEADQRRPDPPPGADNQNRERQAEAEERRPDRVPEAPPVETPGPPEEPPAPQIDRNPDAGDANDDEPRGSNRDARSERAATEDRTAEPPVGAGERG
jgi:hypothetical protein